MSSFFNLFGNNQQQIKDLKQEQILKQIKSVLIRSCKVCNAQSSDKVAYGEDVDPGLTCKRCELKAVNNQPARLTTNLILNDKFSQALSKQIKMYHTNKSNPNNTIKAHTLQSTEGIKTVQAQILQIKQAYTKLKSQTQTKLGQLLNTSNNINKVPVFQDVNKLATDKKLQSIGNGTLLTKSSIVTDSLHFLNKPEIQQDNKRNQKRQEKAITTSQVSLDSIGKLIDHINKLLI